MKSIKVCVYSRSRSFHDDLMLQDQASGERSQDHWSSGLTFLRKNFDTDEILGENVQLFFKLGKNSVFLARLEKFTF